MNRAEVMRILEVDLPSKAVRNIFDIVFDGFMSRKCDSCSSATDCHIYDEAIETLGYTPSSFGCILFKRSE